MNGGQVQQFVRFVMGVATDTNERNRVSTVRCYTAAGEVVRRIDPNHVEVREVKWRGEDRGMAYVEPAVVIEWPVSQVPRDIPTDPVEIDEAEALSIVIAEHARRTEIWRAWHELYLVGIVQ